MALFNKKKDVRELRLPDAPLAFPDLPSEHEMHEEKMESSMPPLPSLPKFQPMQPLKMPAFEPKEEKLLMMPTMPAVRLPERREIRAPQLEMSKFKEPIFVKIDKYREAMANFDLVKRRLEETASLLDRIKETRHKEEEELGQWAEELESIKTKISSIDKKIFSSLD